MIDIRQSWPQRQCSIYSPAPNYVIRVTKLVTQTNPVWLLLQRKRVFLKFKITFQHWKWSLFKMHLFSILFVTSVFVIQNLCGNVTFSWDEWSLPIPPSLSLLPFHLLLPVSLSSYLLSLHLSLQSCQIKPHLSFGLTFYGYSISTRTKSPALLKLYKGATYTDNTS